MPVIVRFGLGLVPAPEGRRGMGVVEPQQPNTLRIVEGQAVREPMRPLPRWLRALHLDLHPIPFVEEVAGAIEIQEIGKFVFRR